MGRRAAIHDQVDQFLERYPDFARRRDDRGGVRLVGRFERVFTAEGLPGIQTGFGLQIIVGERFPHSVPRVFDTDGRIPESYHRIEDGAFCLGSRLRLALTLHQKPVLVTFFEEVVVPYLYRYAHLEKFGTEPWPDLPHYQEGLLLDNARIMGVQTPEECIGLLELIALRRRIANKRPCPCSCRKRLGRCPHRLVANHLRRVRPRCWFRREAMDLKRVLHSPERAQVVRKLFVAMLENENEIT